MFWGNGYHYNILYCKWIFLDVILQEKQRKEKGQVEFLIGNHELMMIQSLFLANEKVKQDWLSSSNGGNLTLE